MFMALFVDRVYGQVLFNICRRAGGGVGGYYGKTFEVALSTLLIKWAGL